MSKQKSKPPIKGKQKEIAGRVLSVEMQKTAVVGLEYTKKHPRYGKRLRRLRKVYAQDDLGVKKGDQVVMKQTRPLSRLKRWIIIRVQT